MIECLQRACKWLDGRAAPDRSMRPRYASRTLPIYGKITAIQANDAFHEVFVRVSNNTEIQLTLDRLMPKVRRLEYAQFGSLAGHISVLQHQAIIAACEQGQPEQAASLTEQNWLSLGN